MRSFHRLEIGVLVLSFLLFAEGCVAKSRYLALEAEGKAVAERLQQEQLKSAALEKEVEGLKGRLAEVQRQAAQREEENAAKMRGLEEQLAAVRESGTQTEEDLKEETARLRTLLEETQREVSRLDEGRTASIDALKEERERLLAEAEERARLKQEFQEAIESHQALIEGLNGKLGALEAERSGLQERLAAQADEIAQLEKGMRMAEGEAARRKRELQEAAEAHEALVGKLGKEIDEGNIKISRLKGRLSVEIVDKILFASGSDRVTKEGKEVLRKMSEILTGVRENLIRVEGHTDNVPIGSKIINRFPTNWELSTSRATQVVRYLAEVGVGPEKMVAIGLSEYRPVALNDTAEGRQRNRRIEIVLFPKDIQEIVSAVE